MEHHPRHVRDCDGRLGHHARPSRDAASHRGSGHHCVARLTESIFRCGSPPTRTCRRSPHQTGTRLRPPPKRTRARGFARRRGGDRRAACAGVCSAVCSAARAPDLHRCHCLHLHRFGDTFKWDPNGTLLLAVCSVVYRDPCAADTRGIMRKHKITQAHARNHASAWRQAQKHKHSHTVTHPRPYERVPKCKRGRKL